MKPLFNLTVFYSNGYHCKKEIHKLIEVKAKSFNPQDENIFIGKMVALSVMETLFI
jgi:hypothetical protein